MPKQLKVAKTFGTKVKLIFRVQYFDSPPPLSLLSIQRAAVKLYFCWPSLLFFFHSILIVDKPSWAFYKRYSYHTPDFCAYLPFFSSTSPSSPPPPRLSLPFPLKAARPYIGKISLYLSLSLLLQIWLEIVARGKFYNNIIFWRHYENSIMDWLLVLSCQYMNSRFSKVMLTGHFFLCGLAKFTWSLLTLKLCF